MTWPLHSSGRLSSFIHLAHTYGTNPGLGVVVTGEKVSNKTDPPSTCHSVPRALREKTTGKMYVGEMVRKQESVKASLCAGKLRCVCLFVCFSFMKNTM